MICKQFFKCMIAQKSFHKRIHYAPRFPFFFKNNMISQMNLPSFFIKKPRFNHFFSNSNIIE